MFSPCWLAATTWTVTAQGMKVPGNEYTGYQGGATWTDYTATFDVQVLTNEAAWLVRASAFDGVRVVLAADNDALGISKPNWSSPSTSRVYLAYLDPSPPGRLPLAMTRAPKAGSATLW